MNVDGRGPQAEVLGSPCLSVGGRDQQAGLPGSLYVNIHGRDQQYLEPLGECGCQESAG